jgi:hypothetical protein
MGVFLVEEGSMRLAWISTLVALPGRIRWGLKIFPEDKEGEDACRAGAVTAAIDVPVADDNAEIVSQAILATSPVIAIDDVRVTRAP